VVVCETARRISWSARRPSSTSTWYDRRGTECSTENVSCQGGIERKRIGQCGETADVLYYTTGAMIAFSRCHMPSCLCAQVGLVWRLSSRRLVWSCGRSSRSLLTRVWLIVSSSERNSSLTHIKVSALSCYRQSQDVGAQGDGQRRSQNSALTGSPHERRLASQSLVIAHDLVHLQKRLLEERIIHTMARVLVRIRAV
jgi:hypothetical protein